MGDREGNPEMEKPSGSKEGEQIPSGSKEDEQI